MNLNLDENRRYQPSLTLLTRAVGLGSHLCQVILCESLTVAGSDITVTSSFSGTPRL